jgi:ATP-dependent protease ClpP protease subunit
LDIYKKLDKIANHSMRINIYSEINDELLEELSEQLEMECNKLEIHINSAGGSVIAGLKVLSMIQAKGVPTECYIEFLAASMAADIAMICDKVYMNKYGLLMFHNAYTQDEEMSDSTKEYLTKQSEMLCKMVSEKRGIDYMTFQNYCNTEKWFNLDEAIAAGLIDGEFNNEEMTMYTQEYDMVGEMYANFLKY